MPCFCYHRAVAGAGAGVVSTLPTATKTDNVLECLLSLLLLLLL
jgi:hypothetical protein